MIVYVRDIVFRSEENAYESVYGLRSPPRASRIGMVEMEFKLTMDEEAVDQVRDAFQKRNGAGLLVQLGRGLAEQMGEEFEVRTRVVVKEVPAPPPKYSTRELQRMLEQALAEDRAQARAGAKAPVALRELDLDELVDDRAVCED